MALRLVVTVVAMMTNPAWCAYPSGLFKLQSSNPFASLSATENAGIQKCQYVIDPNDSRKVQHVQFFFWNLENYVWVNPVFPLCIVPGQVYSYDECGCVYAAGYTGGEGPRFGVDFTTNRVPEKCQDLAGLKFDSDKGRYGSNSYASMLGSTVDFNKMTERVAGTSTGFSLRLKEGAIKLQAFAGNDLQGTWRAVVRVKPAGQESKMLLLSDDCDEGVNPKKEREEPSIVMSISGSTLSVSLRFKNATETRQCAMAPSEWYEIVVESVDSRVTATVNGNSCFDISSPGSPLALTECALFVGGDPLGLDVKQNFDGYLDNFKFVKNFDTCVEGQQ